METESLSRSDKLATPQRGGLDTLAQLGQKLGQAPSPNSQDRLRRRARARFLSLPLAVSLAELRSPLEKSYRNTAYCSATLSQADGKITGRYCGNRWCLVCNRIRTARAIERYLPIVQEWGSDRWLVTLTLRNVRGEHLRTTLRQMTKDFQSIKLGMRRTYNVQLVALRKLECTYNERTSEYHPHFHFIVRGEAAGRLLLARWLANQGIQAEMKGQDIRQCDDVSLRELFKYFTKLLTKTKTPRNKASGQTSKPVPSRALDTIFASMKGLRVYQPVGFKVSSPTPDEAAEGIEPVEATLAQSRASERISWEWSQSLTDWIDFATGDCLTGYEPSDQYRALVNAIESATPLSLEAQPSSQPKSYSE